MGNQKQGDRSRLSRREFLRMAGVAGAGVVAAACAPATPTAAPQATEAPKATEAMATEAPTVVQPAKEGLAPGMIGGPTGFDGAERYQYPADSPAGRAIEALKALPADKKPEALVVQFPEGAVGHFSVPFPEGAPTSQSIFEEETGRAGRDGGEGLSLIHISEPTRLVHSSRMPSSA